MRFSLFILTGLMLASLALVSCRLPPPVEESRNILWQRYAHHPVDEVLLKWNVPTRETQLTDGSRFITYSRVAAYDVGAPDAYSFSCEASFIAPPPNYTIENVALQGNAGQCRDLVEYGPGTSTQFYVPPPEAAIVIPIHR